MLTLKNWPWDCFGTFFCDDHDAKTSEAIEKIATDQ